MEERRNNENNRRGCRPQIPLDRSEVSATQPVRMSGEGKLNKTTESWEEKGGELRKKARGSVRSKGRTRKKFVTNEERKAERKRDKGGYYKGGMCRLVGDLTVTHTHIRI